MQETADLVTLTKKMRNFIFCAGYDRNFDF